MTRMSQTPAPGADGTEDVLPEQIRKREEGENLEDARAEGDLPAREGKQATSSSCDKGENGRALVANGRQMLEL